ncbi:MAG: hypothetical protein KBC98_00750 [Candidatus Pacebacteria bacterium]|nr:hypothetical protein [Candidatus Paceibacterota bacterium]
MAKVTVNFKPKPTTKKLLKNLAERAEDVIVNRFGLGDSGEHMTLEAIGQKYGITRERVRQIENFALQAIKKSDTFTEAEALFDELKTLIQSLGGIVSEDELLPLISKDKVTQNHVTLYLALGDDFKEAKEDASFKKRWIVDDAIAKRVHQALGDIHSALKDTDLVPESEIIDRVLCHDGICEITTHAPTPETAKRWLNISKNLARNPLGEWGMVDSPNVRTRGVRDFAYLVMRKHGSPMHFKEVAGAIEKTFGKKTHIATCHNELIKDERFVLVGRGVYALKEWGYKGGVVREVIEDILKREGPLSKDQVIDKVLKERYLKKNTILVNLQNPKYFKKDKNGLYIVA